MPHVPSRALFGMRFLRHVSRLTRVYWTSSDAALGGLLLALTIALELGTVYGSVLLSVAQRRIFDAFESRQVVAFSHAFGVFLGLALAFVFVSTYRIYVRQRLEIRWRQWLTDHYLEQWISSQAYCQMELHHKLTDNPDQRISEDVRTFVASALGLSTFTPFRGRDARLVRRNLVEPLRSLGSGRQGRLCQHAGVDDVGGVAVRGGHQLADPPRGAATGSPPVRSRTLRGGLPLRTGALPGKRGTGGAVARRRQHAPQGGASVA